MPGRHGRLCPADFGNTASIPLFRLLTSSAPPSLKQLPPNRPPRWPAARREHWMLWLQTRRVNAAVFRRQSDLRQREPDTLVRRRAGAEESRRVCLPQFLNVGGCSSVCLHSSDCRATLKQSRENRKCCRQSLHRAGIMWRLVPVCTDAGLKVSTVI